MSKVMTDNTGKVIMANNKAYIPPANGNVDDVKVNGESVVENKIANIDLTDYAKKEYVDNKNYSVKVVESTTTTLQIQPNKFYKFGEVTELNLTLAEITDTTQLNEFMFEFISGTTATTLTLPNAVKWLETPSIESNKTYQCSIVNNIGILVGVANV